MKNQTFSQKVDERKAELGKKLFDLRNKWPFSERQEWCLRNGYNPDSIRKLYLSGSVNSIPVAEAILETIELYLKNNPVAA